MRINFRLKNGLSILLAFCMVLSCATTTAFAVTVPEGLCEHHGEHTADCGYVERVAGQDCNHIHDDECGYVEAVQEVLCDCTDTDENGALVHSEGCGYVAPVTGADCAHTHDENCGYAEAQDGSPCTFVCEICNAVADETEETVSCSCETDDPMLHATNCPLYEPPENPECFCAEKCTEDTVNVWCDVCGTLGVSACTGEDTGTTYDGPILVADYTGLKTAIEQINNTDTGEFTISLTANITFDANETAQALILNAPVTVNLLGNGYTITGTGKKAMFYIQNGTTLVLGAADGTDSLTLDANAQGSGIHVTNGRLKMYAGVTIQNTKASGEGGVYVYGAQAAFDMYGGTITNCHVTSTGGSGGGGISARDESTLTITGGTISNCSAGKSGGGIWIDSSATAQISGAVITNNYAGIIKDAPTGLYDGMSYWGGGICIGEGTVTIDNCQITNNKVYGWRGGGIFAGNEDTNVSITNCTISGNTSWLYGGGISVFPLAYRKPETIASVTTVSNCTITQNSTNGYDGGGYGGGVSVEGGNIVLASTKVYANQAVGWGDDLIVEPGWPTNYSAALCAVPAGLTLTEDGKTAAITGWYDDGSNVYTGTSEEPVIPLRWGDPYNDGFYCVPIEVTAPVTTTIALKAAYDMNTELVAKYTVTYKADGEVVGTVEVEHGKDATAPEIPAKDGYTAAWDKDGKNITADTEINAVYTINKYTVTYKADGEVVGTVEVEHGADATAPEIPAKDGYTAAWDKDGKAITADTEINAVYTKIPQTDIPQTGDNSMTHIWIILLAVSALGIVATLSLKKRYAIE